MLTSFGPMPTLYAWLLFIHSTLRWLVFATGAFALVRAFAVKSSERPDDRLWRLLVAAVDTQILLGLALYAVLSPLTAAAFAAPALAMKTAGLRFWMVEHPVAMLVGAALLHVGSVRRRKAANPVARQAGGRLWLLLGLIVLLAGVPWPGLPYGRPLLRIP